MNTVQKTDCSIRLLWMISLLTNNLTQRPALTEVWVEVWFCVGGISSESCRFVIYLSCSSLKSSLQPGSSPQCLSFSSAVLKNNRFSSVLLALLCWPNVLAQNKDYILDHVYANYIYDPPSSKQLQLDVCAYRVNSGDLVMCLLNTDVGHVGSPRKDNRQETTTFVSFHLASCMATNALAWAGSVSVDIGKAPSLTQLKAKVLSTSRKVWEQTLQWNQLHCLKCP